jgi:predicted  nucleic acid-binding Zn-ribbon protein
MDSIFIWMLIFAGAAIALLATFLMASERELKIKRREIEILADKLAGSIDASPMKEAGSGQDADVSALHQLETKNRKLGDEIGALGGKLEASEARVRELDAKMRDLSKLVPENERLHATNQELSDEITALKNQLAASQTEGGLVQSQQQALEDKRSALESELARVKVELDKSQVGLEELRNLKTEMGDARRREQEAKDRYAELERQTAELMEQLAANREKLTQLNSLQTRLHDIERRYEEASSERRRLQEEISGWQERFAAARASIRRFAMLRQHLHELHAKQRELAEKHEDIRQGMSALKDLLDDPLPIGFDAAALPTAYDMTYLPKSLPLPNRSEEPSLEAAKRNIDAGYFEDALQQLDQLLKNGHKDRIIKLYHLLASVQLHHGNGFEPQIDAITEMPDLSDTERLIARDIFLARAEEAQKCGRDNEMLRYRAWAKNVIYRAPFGSLQPDSSQRADGAVSKARFSSSGNAAGSVQTPTSSATDSSNGIAYGDPPHGKTRVVILATAIGLLVIAGAMFAGSFGEPKKTVIPPPVPAVQKSGISATSETSEDHAPPSPNSSAVKDESSAARIAPKDKALRSGPSGHSRASIEKHAEAVSLAANKAHVSKPSVKEAREKRGLPPSYNVRSRSASERQ